MAISRRLARPRPGTKAGMGRGPSAFFGAGYAKRGVSLAVGRPQMNRNRDTKMRPHRSRQPKHVLLLLGSTSVGKDSPPTGKDRASERGRVHASTLQRARAPAMGHDHARERGSRRNRESGSGGWRQRCPIRSERHETLRRPITMLSTSCQRFDRPHLPPESTVLALESTVAGKATSSWDWGSFPGRRRSFAASSLAYGAPPTPACSSLHIFSLWRTALSYLSYALSPFTHAALAHKPTHTQTRRMGREPISRGGRHCSRFCLDLGLWSLGLGALGGGRPGKAHPIPTHPHKTKAHSINSINRFRTGPHTHAAAAAACGAGSIALWGKAAPLCGWVGGHGRPGRVG